MTDLDLMTAAYVECALWSTTDNADEQGGEPLDANYDITDLAPETLTQMREDCKMFATDLPRGAELWSAEQMGHDFWLTRNHHGAGFWDRGHGNVGQMLTARAEGHGESDLYVGDDGRLYVS